MTLKELNEQGLNLCRDCHFFVRNSAIRYPEAPGQCLRFPPVAVFRPKVVANIPLTPADFSQHIVTPDMSCGEFRKAD